MSNVFLYDSLNDPNIAISPYPSPSLNIYKISMEGSGSLAPLSIEGSEVCSPVLKSTWTVNMSASNYPQVVLTITTGSDTEVVVMPVITFTADSSGKFASTVVVIPTNTSESTSSGYTYKTTMSLDLYIDLYSSTWMYCKAKIKLAIYNSIDQLLDESKTEFNVNLKTITKL
jgi:hypothetical protein